MSQHQFPCENCGQTIPVTVTMAGSRLTCPHCGHEMSAPKMGVIRSLPLIPTAGTAPTVGKRQWTAASGLLFSLGFLCLIVGLAGGYLSYQKYRVPADQLEKLRESSGGALPDYSSLAAFEESGKFLSVDDLWTAWLDALKEDLSQWQPSRVRFLLDQMDELWMYIAGFLGTAGLGLSLCLASFFFVTRAPVQPR
jgi:DNA-directed RNA polymerase subunit RPC12/RpoP